MTCIACGADNAPDETTCVACGATLEATAPTGPRTASVLVCDLVSFVALSEKHDTEDMRALMDAYVETATTVIERHGGTHRFVGDAVIGSWGVPIAHDDDAEQAVRTALELLDEVEGLGAIVDVPLRARAGVVTAEAEPDEQGEISNDIVEIASWLQSEAEPGQVLVVETTVESASRAIAFDEAGERSKEGDRDTVRTWRALRVVGERLGANRVALEPPFVGRTEELRQMKELLHATGREGRMRLASITGAGGIGKSRLVWELEKYVDGLREDVWWHRGRFPAYGDGMALWALAEMVRMRAGIARTDAHGVSRAKLTEAVERHVRDDHERRWIEPRLAFLLGLEERPPGAREELFAAWRTFFERIADSGTVVMVFEDLQWADDATLDFVEAMLDWSRERPIFVITLARPELAQRRPAWGTGGRGRDVLHVGPLAVDEVDRLVRALVPDASDDIVKPILDRAEGGPLFAVETIRLLADRGILRTGEGTYETVGDSQLGDPEIPDDLPALIAARVDLLASGERSLLQTASVLGTTFTREDLAAVAGARPEELDVGLGDLVGRDLLAVDTDPRSPTRGAHAFVQGMIREIAYDLLSTGDRRQRHLDVARYLEALGKSELAGVVAAHYVEALALTTKGKDAEALAAPTREALGRGADRATALGSSLQALSFAKQALAITASGRERAELLEKASVAARDAGRRDERLAYLREAIDVLHGLGDVNAEVVMMGTLASALGDQRWADEIPQLIETMRARLGRGGDARAKAELANAIAFERFFAGDFAAALAAVDQALAGYERANAWDAFGKAIDVRSILLGLLGRTREARLLAHGRLATATQDNDLLAMTGALNVLAMQSAEQVEALALYLECAAAAKRGGYGGLETTALANGLEPAVETGAWATADRIVDDLLGRADLPDPVADALLLGGALLAAYRGDHAGARTAFTGVNEKTAASSGPAARAWIHRVSSVLRLMNRDLERAYDEAIRAIEEDPGGTNHALAMWSGGRAAMWAGDTDKVRAIVDGATRLPGNWAEAARRSFEAGVAALEGQAAEASTIYDTVLAGRIAVGDRFAHALIVVDAAAVLSEELLPGGAVESARAYLAGLGAAPLVKRLSGLAIGG